MHNTKAYS